jgi:hypothetical protein
VKYALLSVWVHETGVKKMLSAILAISILHEYHIGSSRRVVAAALSLVHLILL